MTPATRPAPPAAPARRPGASSALGSGCGPVTGSVRGSASGSVSLEAVFVLPMLALLISGLLEVAGLVRDVLVVHEAARVGARVAATTTGSRSVTAAVNEAAPELSVQVQVEPRQRRDGDLVQVTVTSHRRIGPVRHRVRAVAAAHVEPVVDSAPFGVGPP